ncbi:WHG domain-containing protein [Nocardia sp. NPDC051321]|uniref:WHG domain-containing protein n=1 Tax=Nocardia sp. NPDC051321 TaxID=3364323 RepID=UPI0037ABCDC7
MATSESRRAGLGRPSSRRERLRQATLEEIVDVSRALLRDGRGLTLGAVATQMGLTAPALYRYVDSAAALNDLVADGILVNVVAEMRRAAESYGNDDPAAQMVAAATTFREWALANTAEFQLAYGINGHSLGRNRISSETEAHPIAVGAFGVSTNGVRMFADFFAEIFVRMWSKHPFPVPAREELDDAFLAIHDKAALDAASDLNALFGDDAMGARWLFELAWAKLYGIITLEVFGHVHPKLVEARTMFTAIIREIGGGVGLAGEAERLADVSRQVRDNHRMLIAGS